MEWISVKDQLPKTDQMAVILNIKYPIDYKIAIYHEWSESFTIVNYDTREHWPVVVTHWIPIPVAPKLKEIKDKDVRGYLKV